MNRNRIKRSVLPGVVTLLWMLLIFMMSSATDDLSDAQSGSVCRFLCETFVEGFEDMPPEEQLAMEESLSFPVRKCAHFTEYTVLGILLAWTAASYCAPALPFFPPFLIGVLYAVSDEIHQLFVSGRAGQVRDVLIDSSGVLIGVLFIYILRRMNSRKKITMNSAPE